VSVGGATKTGSEGIRVSGIHTLKRDAIVGRGAAAAREEFFSVRFVWLRRGSLPALLLPGARARFRRRIRRRDDSGWWPVACGGGAGERGLRLARWLGWVAVGGFVGESGSRGGGSREGDGEAGGEQGN
jgi:hypothetical protein